MDLLAATGMVARVSVAGLLLMSASAKLRSPSAFRGVLSELGLGSTRIWWLVTCIAELLVAGVAIAPVNPTVAIAAIVLLGAVFSAAGLRGLQLNRSIPCVCFGTGHVSRLGWSQLAALPLWVFAAVAVGWWRPSEPGELTALIAAALVTVLVVHLILLVRAMRSAHGDRLAVAETEVNHA